VRIVQLVVSGKEQVTVPAGSFDAFRLEMTSPDDGERLTLWVATEPRRMVKSVAVSPRLNGATITSELLKQGGL
jgi:hypothetical protein